MISHANKVVNKGYIYTELVECKVITYILEHNLATNVQM